MATQFLDLKTGVPANAVYPATDWVAFTPAINNLGGTATLASNLFKWRQDGGDMILEGGFAITTGTNGAGASNVTVGLPTGYQIDVNRIVDPSFGSGKNYLGTCSYYTAGAYTGNSLVFVNSAISVRLVKTGSSSTLTGADMTSQSEVAINCRIPIVGWTSQTVIANQNVFLTYPSIVTNPNFELSTSGVQPAGWEVYADAAGISPVDATGGSVTSGLTFLASNVLPLAGGMSAIFTKPASNCQGQGTSFSGTMPLGYRRAGKQQFTVLIDTTDSNYAAGDLSLFIYDVTNSTSIQTSTSALPAGYRGQWSVTWDSTLASEYRAVIHVASTSALAYSVKFDEFRVGPGEVVQIPVVSESIAFTPPTITGFGTTTSYLKYQIIGSSVRIYGNLLTGTPTATPARIVFPNNWTASPLNNQPLVVGSWHRNSNGTASNRKTGTIFLGGTGSNFVSFGNNDYTTAISSVTEINGNSIGGNEYFSLDYTVQIDQLIGSGTVNVGAGAQVEYASNSNTADADNLVSFANGPDGSLFPGTLTTARTKRVRFSNPIQVDDIIELELQHLAGGGWIPFSSLLPNSTANVTGYGAQLNASFTAGATFVDVVFAQYADAFQAATYGAAGRNWSLFSTWRWRVRKAKASAPVGFGMAGTDGSSGLVSSGRVPGSLGISPISAGYIGQRINGTVSASVGLSVNSPVNAGSIVLPQGSWMIFAQIGIAPVTSSNITDFIACISATSATVDSVALVRMRDGTVGTIPMNAQVVRPVFVSTTTTYYSVVRAAFSSSVNFDNTISGLYAIRMG